MMGLRRVEVRNRVFSYISSLTHQAQLVLAQCSDTLNPAQQRRRSPECRVKRPIDPQVTYAIELPSKMGLRATNPA